MIQLVSVFFFSVLAVFSSFAQEVASAKELTKRISNAGPGEIIFLSASDFGKQEMVLLANGTKEKPVHVKAKIPGMTIFSGKVTIEGSFLELSGVTFGENGMLEIQGTGHRVTRCKWDNSKQGKWLRVLPGSTNIEIDHNTFQNKTSNKELPRDCQLMQIVVLNKNERHHIHHNLFKDIKKGSGNGFETLQLITKNNPFDPPPGACNSIVENNLFLRCDGEAEIISVKSNGNLIRENTFRACQGALVLRHGDDNVATRNYFIGENVPGSGGVRIQGTGQVVTGNYFQDLESYGLGMMDGTPDDLYIRVENAKILFNTFVNCENNFVIGINHSKHPNGTAPKNCVIEGNIFYAEISDEDKRFIEFVQDDVPENWIWNGNVAFGRKVPEHRGIQHENPFLTKNMIFEPTEKTPVVQIKSVPPENTDTDLFGQKWAKKRTAGAVQFPYTVSKNQPLTEVNTGAGY